MDEENGLKPRIPTVLAIGGFIFSVLLDVLSAFPVANWITAALSWIQNGIVLYTGIGGIVIIITYVIEFILELVPFLSIGPWITIGWTITVLIDHYPNLLPEKVRKKLEKAAKVAQMAKGGGAGAAGGAVKEGEAAAKEAAGAAKGGAGKGVSGGGAKEAEGGMGEARTVEGVGGARAEGGTGGQGAGPQAQGEGGMGEARTVGGGGGEGEQVGQREVGRGGKETGEPQEEGQAPGEEGSQGERPEGRQDLSPEQQQIMEELEGNFVGRALKEYLGPEEMLSQIGRPANDNRQPGGDLLPFRRPPQLPQKRAGQSDDRYNKREVDLRDQEEKKAA